MQWDATIEMEPGQPVFLHGERMTLRHVARNEWVGTALALRDARNRIALVQVRNVNLVQRPDGAVEISYRRDA